jgi:16S rRNA (guanine(966)-N(2))-methyltransferase RsmD
VIAGTYRSRRLRSLPGDELRPTADKLRETLFNVLCAGKPEAMEGAVFVDLYAGTGAVGIEALSRGAKKVYFVERDRPAAELIRKNVQGLGSTDFELLHEDTAAVLRKLQARKVKADYIFLDPPYAMTKEYMSTLETLAGSELVSDNSIVIAEHDRKFDPGERFGSLARTRKLEQGDAALSFYRIDPNSRE